MEHTHTWTGGNTVVIDRSRETCGLCRDDALIGRLIDAARDLNPYRDSMTLERLVAVMEKRDGPKAWHRTRARNQRGISGERFNADVTWGVNWAFGVHVWGDRDYGIAQFSLGPFRLHTYLRWGLTEDERLHRWIVSND
jgi:hypothetical protein